jgi:hypothetical protein
MLLKDFSSIDVIEDENTVTIKVGYFVSYNLEGHFVQYAYVYET